MSILDIIYNAKSETHWFAMESWLKTIKTLFDDFNDTYPRTDGYRKNPYFQSWSEEAILKHHQYCAEKATAILCKIKKSDELIHRAVCTLYADEIMAMGDLILHPNGES